MFNGSLTLEKVHEMEDKEKHASKDQVTMDCLREMANDIIRWLEFTSEVSEGEKLPVPCLDSQLWMGVPAEPEKWFQCQGRQDMEASGDQWESGEGCNVMYKFYSKPVANPLTSLRPSARAEGVKVAKESRCARGAKKVEEKQYWAQQRHQGVCGQADCHGLQH